MWFERTATLLAAFAFSAVAQAAIPLGIGRPASEAEIQSWNIDVRGDGQGLPAGRGTVAKGAALFAERCSACHGSAGQGGPADRLVGGFGTLKTANPVRTIGSYWPYAPTLFDYIRRAMPFNAPQTLSNDEVYAAVAYLLNLNGIIPNGGVIDARSLSAVVMPNRNGFTSPDPRPDVPPP